jgi:hypothetical protein
MLGIASAWNTKQLPLTLLQSPSLPLASGSPFLRIPSPSLPAAAPSLLPAALPIPPHPLPGDLLQPQDPKCHLYALSPKCLSLTEARKVSPLTSSCLYYTSM